MRKLSLLIVCLAIFQSAYSQHPVFNPNDPVITYNSASPPVTPPFGTPAKWVRTVRITSWNTNDYKAYYYKGMAFRLRYPKNYDQSGNTKYPIILFHHGRGEPGTVYDNERQLGHAAKHHQDAVIANQFNGFLLFPQNTSGYFTDAHRSYMHELIQNFFIPFLHVDVDRVITHGLSGGAYSTWSYISAYPQDIAAALPASGSSTNNIPDVPKFKHIPIWLFQGGLDRAPHPNTSIQVVNALAAQGGNIRYTIYKNLGHGTWTTAYAESDWWPYINKAHKTVPVVLNGELIQISSSATRDVFEFKTNAQPCPGQPINVVLGLSPGFQAYEWRKDGLTIPGANSNEYVATSFGVYEARFRRSNGVWSPWSVRSIEVREKAATVTPDIQITGLMSRHIPSLEGETGISLEMPEGYIAYGWKLNNTSTILSNNRVYYATQPGQYVSTVTEKFGCSSNFSNPISVIPAAGTNAPPALTSMAGAALSKTSIKIQWATVQNPTFPATGYEIYRSLIPGSNYDLISIAGAAETEFTDIGLTANTFYYYRIRPINNTSAGPASTELGLRTEVDVKAPTTPLNLRVTRVNTTEVALAWDASSDDVSVYRYDVYRNGSVAVVSQNTNAIVFNLTEGQTYQFQVKARDFTGNNSAFSNTVVVNAVGGLTYKYYNKTWSGNNLPNFNTLTPIRQGSLANVDITVGPATTNYGMLFEGKINIPVAGNYVLQTRSDDGSKLYINAYNEANLVVNNDGSHGMQTREGTFNFPAPGMYPIFIAYYQGTSSRGLELYWRNTAHGITTAQRIADSDFLPSETPVASLPTAPTVVSASAVSYDKINVSWTDNSTNETGFQVFRASSINGPYQAVAIVPANTTSYQDASLAGSTTYFYQVVALGTAGPSFDPNNLRENLGLVKFGIGGIENASGTGYIMWSKQNLFTRFRTPLLDPNNSLNLVAVRFFNNQWQYDNNSVYTNFTPAPTDVLIASVNFTTDVMTSLVGTSSTINGIRAGYASGDLTFLPNRWNNASNTNEYTVNGTFFNRNRGPVGQATTSPLPPPPSTPTNFTATALSTTSILLNWNAVNNANGYKLFRSNTITGTYLFLAEFESKDSTSYLDEEVNNHTPYYYRLIAYNVGGNSSGVDANATSLNSVPVMDDLDNLTIRHSVTFDLQLSASDNDSDNLSFSVTNLPAFAAFTDYGDGNALIEFQPTETDLGTFENITINVTDGFGGSVTKSFNLTVNNNYLPTLSAIGNIAISEGSSQVMPVIATDVEGPELLTWTVYLPSFASLQAGADGNSTLNIQPGYADSGVHPAYIAVTDQSGAIIERVFDIVVNQVNPNFSVLVNYRSTGNPVSGWNNINALGNFALNKTNGSPSGISAELLSATWKSFNRGAQTGNNSGVFPDAVIREYFYFGIHGAPETVTLRISGLSTEARYNLKFLASSVWTGVPDNGTTVYTINGNSVPLVAQGNTNNTANFTLVSPNAQGQILVTLSKASGTLVGYLNAFTLDAIYGSDYAPESPRELISSVEPTGIRLNWIDAPYNEFGYKIYRATTEQGSFNEIGNVGPDITSYFDQTALENVTYWYQVSAYNNVAESAPSNTVTQTLPVRPLSISITGSQSIYTGVQTTLTVAVTGSNMPTVNTVITGLPTFATFTSTGLGGTISINPSYSDIGSYPLSITASDSQGKSTSTSYTLNVWEQMLYSVSVNFSQSVNATSPWNNTAKTPALNDVYGNLKNQAGTTTPLSLTLGTAFKLFNMGASTGNNSGVVPDNVLKEYYYFGYSGVPNTATFKISGLDYNNKYTFKFIGSSVFTNSTITNNGETNYTIGNKTVSLNVHGNTSKLARIDNVTANANGEITVTMTKGAGASVGYINGLIIEAYAGDPSIFYPSNLEANAISKQSIELKWNDNSFNETGFEIYRSTEENGTYTLIHTTAANVSSFVNSGLSRGTIYYYKIKALLPGGASPFSNVAGSGTIAFTVLVNVNGDIAYDAPTPWNNLSIFAQTGDLFTNFTNDDGAGTGINLFVVNGMEGTNDWGVSTGNNSGVFPDKVMKSFYWTNEFTPAAEFKLMNLDLSYKYNLGFFGSIVTNAYVITNFTAGGITVQNHQTNNTTSVSTIKGLAPNSNGEIDFRVQEAPFSKWAIFNAFTINAYPTVTIGSQAGRITAKTDTKSYNYKNIYDVRFGESNATISAYPNSFTDNLTVAIDNAPASQASIQLLDMQGRSVAQKSIFLNQVDSEHIFESEITNLQSGLYLLKVTVGNKTIVQRVIRR